MFDHILRNFYRHMLRSKFHMVTIVTGLSIGMAVTLLIYVYVSEERGYDRHHQDASRLYRVDTILEMEGKVDRTAKAALNAGESLMDYFPEIENHTQFLNIQKQTIRVGADLYSSDKVVYADSNALVFFHYPFLEGNPAEALIGPGKVVIAKNIAEQYFGSVAQAMGNSIEVNKNHYQVSGVYEDKAATTHLPYKIFLSLSSLPKPFLDMRNREYMWLTTYNYIKLRDRVDKAVFEQQLSRFNQEHLVPYVNKNEVNGSITFELEPVGGIHLNPAMRFDVPGAINPNHLKIFSLVAMLTLFIALVNYINLTTARVSRRLKEIGIKKSIGATRTSLFIQFIAETLLTVYISFLLCLLIVAMALPVLNDLTEKTFTFSDIVTIPFLVGSHACVFFFGVLASIYPAMLLTSFKTMHALRVSKKPAGVSFIERIVNPGLVRKALVTLQFSVSIFLVIGTIVIFNQFRFLNSVDLGFDHEQVMVIDIPSDTTVSNHLDVIREQLREIPAVNAVSVTSSVPGTDHGAITMNVSQSGGSEIKVINTYIVDDKFLETLGITLSQGRFFSREFSTDPAEAFVINESAVKFLGWSDDPIGKKIDSPLGQKGSVVGVVKDFNYKSLHAAIEPMILMNTVNSQGYLMIKLSTRDLDKTVSRISETWSAFDSAHPYEYFFLDEKFQQQYVKEKRLFRIFTYLASLAIFISCLGLIGLAIFTNELKVKEIGIRKTLGASDLEIIRLLSGGFTMLIVLANIIAWPSGYFVIRNWLDEFAYQIDLTLFPFFAGALVALLIASATIGYFAYKASRADIVKALKYE